MVEFWRAWLDGVSLRKRRILALAVPIIGGMVSQNLLNLIDTGMVGTLGNEALAAVGLGGFLNFLTTSMVLGLSAGVQALSARRQGAGKTSTTAYPLNGGLLLTTLVAVPWSLALVMLAPGFFAWFSQDAEVVALGVPYLRIRLIAMVALGSNFCFRAFWNSINRPGLYLQTLLVMHVSNVFLNWVLIFGNLGAPAMGTDGAAVASMISTFLATAVHMFFGFRHARGAGFLRALPTRSALRSMVRLSMPAGLQQLFFSGGMTAFLWIVGRVGTVELAVTNVLMNLVLTGVLPGLGFGLASASLVGQALGKQDPEDARRWAWEVSKMAMVFVGSFAFPAILFPEPILGLFLNDPRALQLGIAPFRVVASFVVFDTVGLVLMQSLMGAGDTRGTMIASIALQWFFCLPLAYLMGPVLGWGLVAIWGAHVGYRALQTGIFALLWHRGRWAYMAVDG